MSIFVYFEKERKSFLTKTLMKRKFNQLLLLIINNKKKHCNIFTKLYYTFIKKKKKLFSLQNSELLHIFMDYQPNYGYLLYLVENKKAF